MDLSLRGEWPFEEYFIRGQKDYNISRGLFLSASFGFAQIELHQFSFLIDLVQEIFLILNDLVSDWAYLEFCYSLDRSRFQTPPSQVDLV